MISRPSDEEIAQDYDFWVKYVHDEIPDGEFYKMTVREKLEIIAGYLLDTKPFVAQ